MKRFTQIIILFIAVVFLSVLIEEKPSNAEVQQQVRRDVEFQYIIDKVSGTAVPTVISTYTDYADSYSSRMETYSFPDLGIKKPSVGKLDFDSYQWVGKYDVVGNKVYYNDNYTIKSKSELYIFRLYEYDMVTKKLRVMKEVTGKVRYQLRIMVFPNFKGYAVYSDDFSSTAMNDVEIYSLSTNKLLGKVGYAVGESHDNTLDNGNFKFTRVMLPNTLLVHIDKKMIGYSGHEYIGFESYEMAQDGSMKKLEKIKTAMVKWEKKVGSITYAHYYEAKKKQWVIGSKISGKSSYVPLTRDGTEAVASFSPNDKYLLITEYMLDQKTKKPKSYVTYIIDAKTGKLLRELAGFNRKYLTHTYIWDYGDELVYVYFYEYARAGYLNLSTGIFVSSYEGPETNAATSYTGNYAELLSPEKSPWLYFDEKRINFPAQGVFLSDKYIWYVGLNDFSNAIDAVVSDTDGALRVSKDNKSMDIDPKTTIHFRNQAYVPIRDLRSGLGIEFQINAAAEEDLNKSNYYKYD